MSQDVLRRARGFERGNRRRARQDPNRTRRRLAGERVEVALVVGVLAARHRTQRIRRRGLGRRRGRRRNGRCGRVPSSGSGRRGRGRFRWQRRVRGRRRSRVQHAARLHRRQHPADVPIHLAGRARGPCGAFTARRSSLSNSRIRTSRVGARSVPKCSSARRGISTPACATSRHRFCPVGGLRALEARLAGARGDTRFRASTPVDARHPRPRSILVGSFAPSTARLVRSSPLERRPRASRAIGSRPPG